MPRDALGGGGVLGGQAARVNQSVKCVWWVVCVCHCASPCGRGPLELEVRSEACERLCAFESDCPMRCENWTLV